MSGDNENYEELVRIADPIEADLLAAFLEDGEITFKLVKSAQTMASLMPSSQAPIVFYALKDDIPRAQELLEAYRDSQTLSADDNSEEDDDE